MDEHVLLHRPSRTLLVADLVLNVHATQGLAGRVLLRAFGVWRRPAASRLFRLLIRDRQEFAASLRSVLDLDFERVVPGHGPIVERDGPAVIAAAWSSVL